MSDQAPSRALTTRGTNAPTPASDNNLAWSDVRLLGFIPMGDVHEEFYTLTLKLVTYSGTSVADTIERFEQYAISHFEQEDGQMRSTNFPPRDCRLAEHAAVLRSVGDVKRAMAPGEADADVTRSLGMALFDWFPTHADYLDSVLTVWMTKQTMGGKLIVLRHTLVWIDSRAHPHFEGSALRERGTVQSFVGRRYI